MSAYLVEIADMAFRYDSSRPRGSKMTRLVPSDDGASVVERPATDSERDRFGYRLATEGNLLSEEEAVSLVLTGTY